MHGEDEQEEPVVFTKQVETATAVIAERVGQLVIITVKLTFDLGRGKHWDCDLGDHRDPKETGGLWSGGEGRVAKRHC